MNLSEDSKPPKKFVTLNHQFLRRLRKPQDNFDGQPVTGSDTSETHKRSIENPPDLISDIRKKEKLDCDVIDDCSPQEKHPDIDLLIKKKFEHVFTTRKGDVLI